VNHGYRITRVTMPAASQALIDLDQVKAVLNIPPTDVSQDAILTQHIAAVSVAIGNWCDRVFPVQSYRDQLRNVCGLYAQPLVVRQYPIVLDGGGLPQVVITEDGAALDPSLFEVYPETGQLFRLDSSSNPALWTGGQILIDYTSGFPVIPDPVQNAAIEWVTVRWYMAGNDPTTRSEAIPDVIEQRYSTELTIGAMPSGPREMLAPYRIWSV
jgi:hypothetical protein